MERYTTTYCMNEHNTHTAVVAKTIFSIYRMKWWILWWLVLCFVCTIPTICTDQNSSGCSNRSDDNQGHTQNENSGCSNGSDDNPGLLGSHPQSDSAVGGPHSCVALCQIYNNG